MNLKNIDTSPSEFSDVCKRECKLTEWTKTSKTIYEAGDLGASEAHRSCRVNGALSCNPSFFFYRKGYFGILLHKSTRSFLRKRRKK